MRQDVSTVVIATPSSTVELNGAKVEKEAIDKQVADTTQKLQEVNDRLREWEESHQQKSGKKKSAKAKKPKEKKKAMRDELKGSILDAAADKNVVPPSSSFVDNSGEASEKKCCALM